MMNKREFFDRIRNVEEELVFLYGDKNVEVLTLCKESVKYDIDKVNIFVYGRAITIEEAEELLDEE